MNSPFHLRNELEPLAFLLASLCTHPFEVDGEIKTVLPQGAPTSPTITNILCKTLDRRLNGLAKRFKINYQSSTIDKNTITTKPKEKTVNSNNVEIEQYLSDLAYNKMEELDLFKSTAADIERQQIIRKYKLSSYHINAISKLQIIIRSWIIRKKFIKAIRMNKYIEHKHNYKKLKRSIVKFDKKHKKSKAYKRYVNNLQKPYD